MRSDPVSTVRVDKWLWAVRLFKSRSLASAACDSGRVKRDRQSLKPSAALRPGDRLEVPSPDGSFVRTIEVVQLLDKRVGAPVARTAYNDLTPPQVIEAAKQAAADSIRIHHSKKEGDQGRMTKRQRRIWASQLHGFGK